MKVNFAFILDFPAISVLVIRYGPYEYRLVLEITPSMILQTFWIELKWKCDLKSQMKIMNGFPQWKVSQIRFYWQFNRSLQETVSDQETWDFLARTKLHITDILISILREMCVPVCIQSSNNYPLPSLMDTNPKVSFQFSWLPWQSSATTGSKHVTKMIQNHQQVVNIWMQLG